MKIKDLSAAGRRIAILCKLKGIIKAGKQETITRMADITSKNRDLSVYPKHNKAIGKYKRIK